MSIPPYKGARSPLIPTSVVSDAAPAGRADQPQAATPAPSAPSRPRRISFQDPPLTRQPSGEQRRLQALTRYESKFGTPRRPAPLVSQAELDELTGLAIEWATDMQKKALEEGSPLNSRQWEIAMQMEVKHPERIRLTHHFDLPSNQKLRHHLQHLAMLGRSMGKAFGYGVFIKPGHEDDEALLSHELRHVKQCEDFGSIAHFTSAYAAQLNRYEYSHTGIEQDADENQLPPPQD